MKQSRVLIPVLVAVAMFALTGPSVATPGFNQGFETDNSGWNDFGGLNDAVRVPSGTNGVPFGLGILPRRIEHYGWCGG